MQRVKVGMTGLAIVLLLIGLAGAIFRWVNHERPLAAPGATRPEMVANIAQANGADSQGEPLAEIGVTPSGQSNAASPAESGGRR